MCSGVFIVFCYVQCVMVCSLYFQCSVCSGVFIVFSVFSVFWCVQCAAVFTVFSVFTQCILLCPLCFPVFSVMIVIEKVMSAPNGECQQQMRQNV